MTVDGLIVRPSSLGPQQTIERLEAAVVSRGMAILARIDHAAAAAKAGLRLRPTEVLIFGNAAAGTPLMQAAQTLGVDLPLRALVWQDESGKTWIGYNDPTWLANRHGLTARATPILEAMTATLATVAEEAAPPAA